MRKVVLKTVTKTLSPITCRRWTTTAIWMQPRPVACLAPPPTPPPTPPSSFHHLARTSVEAVTSIRRLWESARWSRLERRLPLALQPTTQEVAATAPIASPPTADPSPLSASRSILPLRLKRSTFWVRHPFAPYLLILLLLFLRLRLLLPSRQLTRLPSTRLTS